MIYLPAHFSDLIIMSKVFLLCPVFIWRMHNCNSVTIFFILSLLSVLFMPFVCDVFTLLILLVYIWHWISLRSIKYNVGQEMTLRRKFHMEVTLDFEYLRTMLRLLLNLVLGLQTRWHAVVIIRIPHWWRVENSTTGMFISSF